MKKSVLILAVSASAILFSTSSDAQVIDSSKKAIATRQVPVTKQDSSRSTATTSVQTQTPAAQAATEGKVAGGVLMVPGKSIIDNTSKAAELTSLVSAIKATGLTDTLAASGNFTVFAPTNDAFKKLPQGSIDTTTAAGKDKLENVVKYHVIPGKFTKKDIALAIAKGKGKAELTTVEGDVITASVNENHNLELTDSNGNKALVTTFDAEQSNGVVHVINNVLLPK
ncbi:fasciclin domain-containing protein [Hufsiella ginkgonis]|uniref:Fasciclin domain-containing protein n=1 Tax=Hufsiella ginkgonis TaxID=2695274 RepID=A0A7K1XWZ1_9SPHI|nr:fasciclin domain-containing protein [Hufsiella ginkgonis]MXV15515.1 fasciclin domain-containing protein [Hufsiella ginkgonis]